LWGKGVGYGTQSKLQFLPEYETDFIFAAFAEEWGFAGVVLLFIAYAVLMGRLLVAAYGGATNFETLFILGVAIYFLAHIIIHIGINVGLLPVTGTTVPFMSYGGSHLLTEFMALGMVNSMRRFGRTTHKADLQQEFVGV
jgi:rod shape determining protein RodA